MITKFVTATVVSGALALGAGAGVASAATSPGPSGSAPARHTLDCSKAPRLLERIENREQKAQAFLTKLQAALAKAQQNGNTQRADRVQKRIDRVQTFLTRAPVRIQKIQAVCPGAQPASGSSTTS